MEELVCDSEDLPDDDEEEEEYEVDDEEIEVEDSGKDYVLAPDLTDESNALIEDSQTMDEAVVNILDDPRALSMTLKNQYDSVTNKNAQLREAERN